ncbi:hypothetical protein A2165_02470 [Candidatus Curtissbacteria bacterium RBG_13_40_7]|uniref:Uncharacterized protein n=1 Tax=Candidatus Curtissbacteria bacterium RBG_13_40_7 TaxID=1797706 RepID=A0A1F5FYJ2_9BACT|nr:MAG: hypothetical protein A2165_02470 [Candidatus Curtissbacteria bacterium RBG_13_40_7]
MTERDRGAGNPGQEDPRRKFRLTEKTIAVVTPVAGGIYGGIGYGIARFFSNSEIANRVGLGIGLGISGAMAGSTFGILSRNEAEKFAIKGQVGKAMRKVIRGSAEAGIGLGASGVAAGYEASGVRGAIIGGITGVMIGAVGMSKGGSAMRELGIAHRDCIIPAKDPSSFPEFGVTRDSRFNEDEVDLFAPPVYDAPSIGALKGFRQAQVEHVCQRAKSLSGIYKTPELALGKLSSAIFIIPDVVHYPAFDPKKEPFLFGKLEEPSERVQLNSPDDKLVVRPYRENNKTVWPYSTEFQPWGQFNDSQWKYWREISWRKGVVILAKREIKGREEVESETPKLIVKEQYFLVDILLDKSERGIKRRKRKPQEVKEPVPVWNPNPINN